MLARNRVNDYDRWRTIFDANTEAAEKAGLKLVHMWRDTADANHVFFMFALRSIDDAMAFVNDPKNAEVGVEAGVIAGEYHIVEDVL